MKNQYPENVINKILEITLATHNFCYLSLSADGILINRGGNFSPSPLADLKENEQCFALIPFISVFLQDDLNMQCIPTLDLGADTIVDVHLFKDTDLVWAILIDKSADIRWQAEARQKNNDLRLLEQKLEGTHFSNIGQIDFFSALGMIALAQNNDGSFSLLRPACECFKQIYPESFDVTQPTYPQKKFLFVENFLIDAEEFWKNADDHSNLSSGPWLEYDTEGKEVALEATAAKWDGNKLLFIKRLANDYNEHQTFLQIGREGVLLNNQLEAEVRKRTEMIRAREEEIALRLVCAADKRDDGETGSHIRRLGLYSEVMAKHLGWPQDQIDEIRIAAPMHDIGKIGIPDSILRKPATLTAEEYEVMKTHTKIGGQILSNSNSHLVQMAREISLGHHEKWDGSGYPKGLRGDDIPISARIVAIADVFDALIHKRCYKDEMEIDKAIELLEEGRGTHFDPQLLDLFISLADEMTKISKDYKDPIVELEI